MTQMRKAQGRATHVGTDSNGDRYVQYHATRVVAWNEKTVTLRNAGYYTNTTRDRMNQAANEFGLGYRVYQKKGEWYVELPFEGPRSKDALKANTVVFEDGMTFPARICPRRSPKRASAGS